MIYSPGRLINRNHQPVIAPGRCGFHPPGLTALKNFEGTQVIPEGKPEVDATVRAVLKDVLALSDERVSAFDDSTPLFGALPELDSMAVAGVLTEIEDRLGIVIDDDEVDGDMLETFGALTTFAASKSLV